MKNITQDQRTPKQLQADTNAKLQIIETIFAQMWELAISQPADSRQLMTPMFEKVVALVIELVNYGTAARVEADYQRIQRDDALGRLQAMEYEAARAYTAGQRDGKRYIISHAEIQHDVDADTLALALDTLTGDDHTADRAAINRMMAAIQAVADDIRLRIEEGA